MDDGPFRTLSQLKEAYDIAFEIKGDVWQKWKTADTDRDNELQDM
jgi:hypothetical protein